MHIGRIDLTPIGRIALTVALAAAYAALSACTSEDDPGDTNPPTTATVSMPGFSFTPFTTTIAVGGTVTFDFPNEDHNVIFGRVNGAPSDIQPIKNAKVDRRFTVAGTFPYDCTLHPGMSGVIVAR